MSEKIAITSWVITVDHIAIDGAPPGTNSNAVGITGPYNSSLETADEIRNHPDRVHFKMYDDDNNLCYSGYYVIGDDENWFAPLDHYGMPNAGCSYMRIRDKETGKYEPV